MALPGTVCGCRASKRKTAGACSGRAIEHPARASHLRARRRCPAVSCRYPPFMRKRAFFTRRRTCTRTSLSESQSCAALASAPWKPTGREPPLVRQVGSGRKAGRMHPARNFAKALRVELGEVA